MQRRIGLWPLLFILFLLSACESGGPKWEERHFYHWKMNWDWSKAETQGMQALGSKKIYLHLADFDWVPNQDGIYPIAHLQWPKDFSPPDIWKEVVPVFFITNRSFLQQNKLGQLELLAQNTAEYLRAYEAKLPAHLAFKELQIDCDWSLKTKEAYFLFLKLLKKELGQTIRLSVTLRLHQVKYQRKTGIPPADRTVLMFYNMGALRNWETENSILDLKLAQNYLDNFSTYPLAMDLALPIFHWGACFRAGKLQYLLNKKTEADFLATGLAYKKLGPMRYTLLEEGFFGGHYLYEGDQIRFEACTLADLEESLAALRPIWPEMPDSQLLFYELQSVYLEQLSANSLRNLD
ncbi:hypothetical protein PPO43_15185 [Saprospira sp. CCB-QB6]|uniref:hypothetical protein n=1 Tax=Saprospira sp. CCB-QB6 TaxID=3023936 RepID=UPI00234922D6|nr:hypothetical protein [Saprospira sp. CCB-QB6]WCL81318.1 hypothetical protein PPO43_15185 [Saprospira sp. CCB-QB6]